MKFRYRNRTINLPSDWSELTVGQRIKIGDETNRIKLIGSLLGVDDDIDISVKDLRKIMESDIFTKVESYEKVVEPILYFRGKKVILRNLNYFKFGAYKDMQMVIFSDISIFEKIVKVVAIYLQASFGKEYDSLEVELYEKEVLDLKFVDVYNFYNFFLLRLNGLRGGIVSRLVRKMSTRVKRLWQDLMRWKSLVFGMFYRAFVKVLIVVGIKFY